MSFRDQFKKYLFSSGNINLLSEDKIKKIARFLSWGLIVGSIINFISNYLFDEFEPIVLYFSIISILMGIIILFLPLKKLSVKSITVLLTTVMCLIIPILTLLYIEYSSITIWAFPFVFIIIALLFASRIPLLLIGTSTIITQVIVWIIKPANTIEIIGTDYFARIGILIIGLIIATFVSNIYRSRLEENNKQLKEIENLAFHDYLTNLPNKFLFLEQLNHSIKLSERKKQSLAIFFLDLDDFKSVNDALGHSIGDKLLISVANRLTAQIRGCDICARVGGDEFLITFENINNMEAVSLIAKKINLLFNEPFELEAKSYYISAAIGIAIYPIDGINSEELIKSADIAMYEAKKLGKNRYKICEPEMRGIAFHNNEISQQMFNAINMKEFELYYQPIVNNESRKIVGVEALLRWKNLELGEIPPGQFIPIAEKNGLIDSIGKWVILSACRQCKEWQSQGLPRVRMSINISTCQLQNTFFLQEVEAIIKSVDLDPRYLEFEITESVAMLDPIHVITVLNALRAMGIRISIDDFGTEYSSLLYLKQIPADRLKISTPFIHGIGVSTKDESIIKAIIVLAKNMQFQVTAEGVETMEQLNFLTDKECDDIQGYYFYKPMPASEATSILLNSKSDSKQNPLKSNVWR
jgi:diguanylate cyclase (GGDEF)-like protein